jgi:hypothetical protein
MEASFNAVGQTSKSQCGLESLQVSGILRSELTASAEDVIRRLGKFKIWGGAITVLCGGEGVFFGDGGGDGGCMSRIKGFADPD